MIWNGDSGEKGAGAQLFIKRHFTKNVGAQARETHSFRAPAIAVPRPVGVVKVCKQVQVLKEQVMIHSFGRSFTQVARFALASLVAGAALGVGAAAAEPKPTPLGTFNDWNAYSIQENGKTVCFVVSEPKSDKLSNPSARRGDPFFLVTVWDENGAAQPSVLIGYPQAAGSKTKVTIGSKEFQMFVEGDGAWMESEALDNDLVEAMKAGASMTVVGRSARGTISTDRYSLSGITAALDKIKNDCK